MSVQAMTWAWQQDLEPVDKLVLLALANRSNHETGVCFPGQKLIAQECSMSDRSVRRHLKNLEKLGLIQRRPRMRGQGRGRTSDEYRIAFFQSDNLSGKTRPTGQDDTTNRTTTDDQPDTGVLAEPEENRKGNQPLAAAPRERKNDPLWDTMLRVCGIDPNGLTKTARGQINAALKELRDIAATPADLQAKAAAYRKTWPEMSITPTALVKHWGQLAVKAGGRARCDDCRQFLDAHDEEFCAILSRGGL